MLKFNFDKLKPQQQIQLMSLLNNPYTLTLREEEGQKLTIQQLDDNFRYFLNNVISGTANQVAYFDADGNISSDEFFTRTDETTTIQTAWWTPDYLQFTGSGLNDGVLLVPINGYYTGPTNSVYTITISATGPSADFIDWSSTSGASGSNVEIVSGDPTGLDSEIGVYFPSTTGYTIGDSWQAGIIQMTSFHLNGEVLGNGGIANGVVDQTNNIASVFLLGNASGGPNGLVSGLFNFTTEGQSLINMKSEDGSLFTIDLYASDGNVGSQISMSDTIRFNFQTGDNYTFPTTNAQGPLVNDGGGSLFFETGWNGTYSTGAGQIVTVTNGIITNVGYPVVPPPPPPK